MKKRDGVIRYGKVGDEVIEIPISKDKKSIPKTSWGEGDDIEWIEEPETDENELEWWRHQDILDKEVTSKTASDNAKKKKGKYAWHTQVLFYIFDELKLEEYTLTNINTAIENLEDIEIENLDLYIDQGLGLKDIYLQKNDNRLSFSYGDKVKLIDDNKIKNTIREYKKIKKLNY